MKKYLFIMLAAASVAIVSCKPQPKPEKEVTFEISVSDVTAQEATVSVVPSDTSKLYYYAVIPSESAATFESMEAMADTIMLYLKKQIDMYAAYGYTRYFNELMDKGNASYTFDELSAQTSYTAFAFVADTVNLVHVGKVAVKAFTTAEVPQVKRLRTACIILWTTSYQKARFTFFMTNWRLVTTTFSLPAHTPQVLGTLLCSRFSSLLLCLTTLRPRLTKWTSASSCA